MYSGIRTTCVTAVTVIPGISELLYVKVCTLPVYLHALCPERYSSSAQ